MTGDRVLALVPARGGSKGLPGKNVRAFLGKPLLAWTIDAAVESGLFEDVVVSTDDEEIAAAARSAGAEVLMRPAELAGDEASMIDVVVHAIDSLATRRRHYTHLMLLQPTSPLRTASDIRDAWTRLAESGGQAVVSVSPMTHSPLLANTLPADGSMVDFLRSEAAQANRQALPTYYQLNGAIYLAETDLLRTRGSFIGAGTFALVMPPERGIDIDSEVDFAVAELLAGRAAEPPA